MGGEYDVLTDAAVRLWVCEKGHVDDHHYDNEPYEQRCSRCGDKCERMAADHLAAEYVERLRINVGLVAENAQLRKRVSALENG